MREGEKEEKVIYTLSVPKGGDKIYVEGSHEKEIQLKYPDSSYIYITNNSESASYLNYDNISRLGQEIYSKKLLKDTLLLEGTQPNGNFWKENKLGDIVIGYHNVPESKKALYDKSLESLTMR